jgi:hypothetical protein
MKITSLAAALCLLIGLSSRVAADSFTLKDGKVLEGKILRTEGDVYVIEYQVTRAIKDIKKVAKKDVVKITTAQLDSKDFEQIAKLIPTPDLLTEDEYKQRLLAVQAFIAKYPKSAMLKDAEAIAKRLTEESAVVVAGGRKFQGMMIPGADYRANAVDLDARALEAKIRDAAAKAQWLTALRTFSEFDKDYQAAACYREVLPVVIKSLQAFRAQISASIASYDARMEKQIADFENMPKNDGENSKRALEEQLAELEKRYQKEKAAMLPWVTPHPAHKQSLEDVNTFAEAELLRLTTAQSTPAAASDAGKIFRNTWKIIHSTTTQEELDKAMAEAETAGMPAKHLKTLQAEAKAANVKPAEK